MKITLYGAAGNVTGSAYYVESKTSKILVDFGIFQGNKSLESLNKKPPPFNTKNLDSVILTHAHLDHTGRLPSLVKDGYTGPVYATAATIDISEIILMDSARVQISETKKMNRKLLKSGKPLESQVYPDDDVRKVLSLMKAVPYNEYFEIAEGVKARVRDSGHILGSVSIELTIEEEGRDKVIIFSGDLGPDNMAIIKNPEFFNSADLVFMESTYGDHDHKSLDETLTEGKTIIERAIELKGKIIVPSIAIGRTQQLLYYVARAAHRGNLPMIPVYLDSPMGIEATKIYLKHKELYDEETTDLFRSGAIKGDFSGMHISRTSDESRALNEIAGPCMIIAGSGMCNAGRILHHLKHNLGKSDTTVMFVGYQGAGSLGRKLLDGAARVRIFNEFVTVKSRIASMGGLSAHAGQRDLIKWFESLSYSKPRLVLSHGEDRGRKPLSDIIKKRYNINPVLPSYGEVIEL